MQHLSLHQFANRNIRKDVRNGNWAGLHMWDRDIRIIRVGCWQYDIGLVQWVIHTVLHYIRISGVSQLTLYEMATQGRDLHCISLHFN